MTESLHLYLTNSKVYARKKTGLFWKAHIENIGEWDWSSRLPETLPLHLVIEKSNSKRLTQVYVYLGAALCKLMVVDLPPNLRDNSEKTVAAHAYMMQKLGLNIADWRSTIDATHGNRKAVVCAAQQSLLLCIEKMALAQSINVASISPYFRGVWNIFQKKRTVKKRTALLALENDAFTIAIASNGVIDSVSTLMHQGESNIFDREIKRLHVSLGNDDQTEIFLACTETLVGKIPLNFTQNLLLAKDFQNHSIWMDFSDLMFQAQSKVAV